MQLLDGKQLADILKDEIAEKVRQLVASGNKKPHLAIVLVGEDGASQTYVNHKVRSCQKVGINHTLIRCPSTIGQGELLAKIEQLNQNPDVDGYIVQLPLPKHINEQSIVQAIDPKKDVDGFHPVNVGRMAQNLPCFLPATPYGILQLLKRNNIATAGKHCVIIGRSNIVGTPLAILLSRNSEPGNCTVTICHSRTRNLAAHCQSADILVAAIGQPGFVAEDMVKPGAVVIDVGTTRVSDGSKKSGFRLAGDVDFAAVAPKCSYITPVPGGVGPMTVVSLLANTLKAAGGEL